MTGNQPDRYLSALRQYWGYPDFRGIQRQIIESIGSGRDTLGLMPTGGGKSITFQVPALCQEGVCIVITPLIALMKDQVHHLRRRGILAAAIYSGMTHKEILTTLENCILGNTKLLYISPERIASPLFITKLRHINVSFITVDEAHCISLWGYDFRPAYLAIADIRKLKPGVPVLALTATATPQVVDDIQEKLGFREKNVFSMSFARKNLAYIVRKTFNKDAELVHMLNAVGGSAIVYTRNRKGTKETAQMLTDQGISATFYHAGLEPAVKDQRQTLWQKDEIRVMVATNAFGMGIDKPDVRLVVHTDCPDSLEAYFQEAGRGGRDGKKSYSVLLFDNSEVAKLQRRVHDNFPDIAFIRNVYEHLAYFYQIAMGSGSNRTHVFNINDFCRAYHFYPVYVDSALRILNNAGYILYETDPENSARVKFLLTRNDLYRLDALTPNQENIVNCLLRGYGGIFQDLVDIDESYLSMKSGLSQQEVYITLKTLSMRSIIHFIPRRTTPYITYARDREEADRLVIPSNVYDDRKQQLEKNIGHMISYATNDEECRSKQILEYFGETGSHRCRQCDVCLAQKQQIAAKGRQQAVEATKALLADRQEHSIDELMDLKCPSPDIAAALAQMESDKTVVNNNSAIRLAD